MPESKVVTGDNPVDTNKIVSTDSFCIACGYNLRGLPIHGNCPECGSDKTESLRSDLLQYADAAWRRTVYWGLTLLALAPVVFLIAPTISFMVYQFGAALPWMIPAYSLVGVLLWLSLVLAYTGLWLASTREPLFDVPRKHVLTRRITHIAAAVGIASFVLSRSAWQGLAPYASIVNVVCLYASTMGVLRISSSVAGRIPNAGLARRLGRMSRGLLYCCLCVLVAAVLHRISEYRTSFMSPYSDIFDIAVKVSFAFSFLCILFGIYVLSRVRRVLKEIADRARTA